MLKDKKEKGLERKEREQINKMKDYKSEREKKRENKK